jgi:PAS domain S-box-containing protein
MHTAPRVVRMESWAKSGSRTCRTVMIDITQQKIATEALERNLAAQEALLKAIPAVVFYQDMNLRFIAVSQAFADFTGHTIADLIGKTAYDVLPQAVADDFHGSSRQVLDSGAVSVVPEYQMCDAQGDQIFVSVVRTPYRDVRGKIIGLVGAGIDISAIKLVSNINAQLLQENRSLTRNLFEIQETERRHLARELHDELGQWLTAIQAEAQAICNISTADPKILDGARAINTSAKAVHEVVRSMLRHLRPSLLDELGLTDSLHELQRQWCRSRPQIVCEFNLDIPPAGMSENINITVYRLIQEALSNVANHANAGKVVVTLQREAGNTHDTEVLLLNIEDDGVGFDTQMKTSGMGVLGMRERIIAAGGGFVIYSRLGQGTHIQASLPLTFQEST